MDEYQIGDRIYATWRPVTTDDLRPEVTEYVGRRFLFRYLWTADDGERYAGQPVFAAEAMDFWWVPLEDLADIYRVGPDRVSAAVA